MKIKLKDIVISKDVLVKLMQEQLSAKASYSISKIWKVLEPELQLYEDQRQKLVKKYGEQTTQGSDGTESWRVKAENQSEFYKELEELAEQEIEVVFSKIPITYLEDGKGKTVYTPIEISKIDYLFI